MKAITYHRYGAPDVIGLEEVPTPTPSDGEILVRVHAGVVTPSDGAARKGQPFLIRLMGGIRRPKQPILGSEIAGEVAAVGRRSVSLRAGRPSDGRDRGHLRRACRVRRAVGGRGRRAHARWRLVRAGRGPGRGTGDRDAVPARHGKVQPGMHVLINGGSGSVGSGGHPAGEVPSGRRSPAWPAARNLELMRSLGADHVIDYTRGRLHCRSRSLRRHLRRRRQDEFRRGQGRAP